MFISFAMLACVALPSQEALSDLPTRLSLQDPAPAQEKPPTPQEPPAQEPPAQQPPADPPQAEDASLLLDFDRLEGNFRVGLTAFSEDFESDPQLAVSALFRAPSPWLSRDFLGLEGDDFGAFAELRISRIDRDVDFLDKTSGTLVFIAAGLDFTLVRDEEFLGMLQMGLQYGWYGGVDDTDDGVALLFGAVAGYQVSEGVWLTLNPQAAIADAGDHLFFLDVGVQVGF